METFAEANIASNIAAPGRIALPEIWCSQIQARFGTPKLQWKWSSKLERRRYVLFSNLCCSGINQCLRLFQNIGLEWFSQSHAGLSSISVGLQVFNKSVQFLIILMSNFISPIHKLEIATSLCLDLKILTSKSLWSSNSAEWKPNFRNNLACQILQAKLLICQNGQISLRKKDHIRKNSRLHSDIGNKPNAWSLSNRYKPEIDGAMLSWDISILQKILFK